MQKESISSLLVLFLLIPLTTLAQEQARRVDKTPQSGFEEIDEIHAYEDWTFKKGPFQVSPSMAQLCSPPAFLGHPGTRTDDGTGYKTRSIFVFANDIAAEKLRSKRSGEFAAGSVILKQKLDPLDQNKVVDLGVMIKRASGFDPQNDNWEFLFLSRGNQTARGTRQLGECYSCHALPSYARLRTDDYVFVDRYKYLK